MTSQASLEIGKKLYNFKRANKWTKGIGVHLPPEYKKFFNEWKVKKPLPVHYIERQGKYYLDEKSRIVQPVQNVPIPLRFPKEHDEGLWGGEGVIQGFVKKHLFNRRVPKFWFPRLMSSVVYSQVLDLYLKVTVTPRALELIHANYGLDHYILKTSACDIRTLLGIKLKRQILLALSNKTLYPHDPVKREEIYEIYKKYLDDYTPKEIEWYGLKFEEAIHKYKLENVYTKVVEPKKIELRRQLIEELRNSDEFDDESSLLDKFKDLNPFKSN